MKEKKRRNSIETNNRPRESDSVLESEHSFNFQQKSQHGKLSPPLSSASSESYINQSSAVVDVDFEEAVATFGKELYGLFREWIWIKQNVSVAMVGERGVGKSFLINSLLEATFQDNHTQKTLTTTTTTNKPVAPNATVGGDLDSDFCLIPDDSNDNSHASDSDDELLQQQHQQQGSSFAEHNNNSISYIDENFTSFVNWSSEQEASKNIAQYCTTGLFNSTVADRYSYLLPQGPFANMYSRNYCLTYSAIPELHIHFITEIELRNMLWRLHQHHHHHPTTTTSSSFEATTTPSSEQEIQYLKRQYRQVLNVSREQIIPIPGIFTLNDIPLPSDIKPMLGRHLIFKGKGSDLNLDRIFIREKLLEMINQYGFIIEHIQIMLPCGILQGNRELFVLGM